MALDVQRNWDTAMAENLEKLTMKARDSPLEEDEREQLQGEMPPRRGAEVERSTCGETVYLPDEIIIQILFYTTSLRISQTTLASCCLVSRQWYSVAVPLLYHSPRLYGHNFSPFVASICPSKNLSVRDSPLASLVRTLDMSALVHQATNRITARLLGRTKANLEVFVAPVRGFAMNAFAALSKSANLRTLDLSLACESPPLPELFKSISHLEKLRTFRLPRSAGFGIHHSASSFPWPPNLTSLSLSGGIDAHFLHGVVGFPPTLRSLTIEHCPSAKGFAVTHLLRNAVAPLKALRKLKIAHMPRLSSQALDGVLFLLPQLEELSISVDYVTPAMFDEGDLNHIKEPLIAPQHATAAPAPYPASSTDFDTFLPSPSISRLRTLELTYSGGSADITDKISPLDIMIAIDDGALPDLRRVRVASSLMWQDAEAESLSDVLIDSAESDGTGQEAGVWRFEG